MPSTLAALRTRLALRLADPSHAVWSTEALDEALRAALHDYGQVLPHTAETVLTVPGPGLEIALNGLDGLLFVLDVWWPYDSLVAELFPRYGMPDFRLYWDDAQPVLLLAPRDGSAPCAGDEVRLWYARPHTIQDLDGAAVTTPYAYHESGLLTGAAGYAAAAEHLDQAGQVRLDPAEARTLSEWGAARRKEFTAWLAGLRTGPGPTANAHNGGWRLDKWDP